MAGSLRGRAARWRARVGARAGGRTAVHIARQATACLRQAWPSTAYARRGPPVAGGGHAAGGADRAWVRDRGPGPKPNPTPRASPGVGQSRATASRAAEAGAARFPGGGSAATRGWQGRPTKGGDGGRPAAPGTVQGGGPCVAGTGRDREPGRTTTAPQHIISCGGGTPAWAAAAVRWPVRSTCSRAAGGVGGFLGGSFLASLVRWRVPYARPPHGGGRV